MEVIVTFICLRLLDNFGSGGEETHPFAGDTRGDSDAEHGPSILRDPGLSRQHPHILVTRVACQVVHAISACQGD